MFSGTLLGKSHSAEEKLKKLTFQSQIPGGSVHTNPLSVKIMQAINEVLNKYPDDLSAAKNALTRANAHLYKASEFFHYFKSGEAADCHNLRKVLAEESIKETMTLDKAIDQTILAEAARAVAVTKEPAAAGAGSETKEESEPTTPVISSSPDEESTSDRYAIHPAIIENREFYYGTFDSLSAFYHDSDSAGASAAPAARGYRRKH